MEPCHNMQSAPTDFGAFKIYQMEFIGQALTYFAFALPETRISKVAFSVNGEMTFVAQRVWFPKTSSTDRSRNSRKFSFPLFSASESGASRPFNLNFEFSKLTSTA